MTEIGSFDNKVVLLEKWDSARKDLTQIDNLAELIHDVYSVAQEYEIKQEQERIIKLLEEHRNDFSVHRGFGEIENLADDAIALIKGEK